MLYMLIQISDLFITEKIHDRIYRALISLITLIKELQERNKQINPVILIAGNIFATRTYLSTEDIHFFEKIMGFLSKFNVVISLGSDDIDRQGLLLKNGTAFSGIVKNHPSCVFISQPGVVRVFGEYDIGYATTPSEWPAAADFVICRMPEKQIAEGPLARYKYGVIGSGGSRRIDKKNSIAFAGPFVQNRPSDGIRFGCVVWKPRDPVFVPLKQAAMELLLKYSGDQEIKIPSDVAISKAILRFSDCSSDFMSRMEEYVGQIYNCNVVVVDDKMTHQINEDQIKTFDPHSKQKHLEIIRKICGPEHPHGKFIQEFYERKTGDVSIQPALPWRIRYLVWDNIYCYRAGNYIDFEKIHNLTFIVGANKSGKSTIIDLIILSLFGIFMRGDVRDLINKFESKARVKCCFIANGNEYVVQRSFHKTASIEQKFCLVRNGEDITPANIKELYKFIGDTLGVTLPAFKLNMIQQTEPLFVDMSKSQRKEMLLSILNLGYLKPIYKQAAQHRKELQKRMKESAAVVGPNELLEVEREMTITSSEIGNAANDVIAYGASASKDVLQGLVAKHRDLATRFKELVIAGHKTASLPTEIGKLTRELEVYTAYEKCVGIEGIPLHIFQDLLGHINGFINNILDKISDFHVMIVSCFEIYTITNQRKVPASMASGYQKFLIEVCMRITLLRVLPQLTGFDLLFIDEGFGCLDKDNFLKVSKAIDLIKRLFKIVIITHVDELHSYAEDVIEIKDRVQYGQLDDAAREFYPMREEIKKILKKQLPRSHLKTK